MSHSARSEEDYLSIPHIPLGRSESAWSDCTSLDENVSEDIRSAAHFTRGMTRSRTWRLMPRRSGTLVKRREETFRTRDAAGRPALRTVAERAPNCVALRDSGSLCARPPTLRRVRRSKRAEASVDLLNPNESTQLEIVRWSPTSDPLLDLFSSAASGLLRRVARAAHPDPESPRSPKRPSTVRPPAVPAASRSRGVRTRRS